MTIELEPRHAEVVYNPTLGADIVKFFQGRDMDRKEQISKGFVHILRGRMENSISVDGSTYYLIEDNNNTLVLTPKTYNDENSYYQIMVRFNNTTKEELKDMFKTGFNFVSLNHVMRVFEKVKSGKIRLVKEEIGVPKITKESLRQMRKVHPEIVHLSGEEDYLLCVVDYGDKEYTYYNHDDDTEEEESLTIGKYIIEMEYNKEYENTGLSIKRTNGAIDQHGRYISPFIKADMDGYSMEVCFGSAQPIVNKAMKKGDLLTVLHYAIELIDGDDNTGGEPYVTWNYLNNDYRTVNTKDLFTCAGCTRQRELAKARKEFYSPNDNLTGPIVCSSCMDTHFGTTQPKDNYLLGRVMDNLPYVHLITNAERSHFPTCLETTARPQRKRILLSN